MYFRLSFPQVELSQGLENKVYTGGIDLQHIGKERMKKDSERMGAVSRATNVDASVGRYPGHSRETPP